MARCSAELIVRTKNAPLAAKAISVDNLDYIRTRCEGDSVITTVEVDSVGSMLSTLDDLLVNLKVVDDVLCGNVVEEDKKE